MDAPTAGLDVGRGGWLILGFFAWTLKQKRMRGTARAESKQERRLLRNPVGVCHRRARSAGEDPVGGGGGGGQGGGGRRP